MTKDGRRVVLIDIYRSFKTDFVSLEPQAFPEGFSPLTYWERLPYGNLAGFHGCLTGRDVPLDLRATSPLWNTFPLAEDPDSSFEAAASLISEALVSKQWAIPNGAVVKLRVGPFEYFELWEFGGGVYFLGRSRKGEYAVFWLNMKHGVLVFQSLDPYQVTILEKEGAERLHAALMLLFSAIVRDFLVIETREKVFETRRQRLNIPGSQREGPITIYLPRVKYVSSADVQRCASELSHHERRPHFVRAHLRKSSTASEYQLSLASIYSFDVPSGYTFVRPHERGHKSRDTIYRSRSALQSLFQSTMLQPGAAEKPADWFQFERDVQTIMKKLGFQTEHVAASHGGDHGVDIYATKGQDLDAIAWVIQCKCYSPNRKVQPSTVRELLGVLAEYPRGTRGMIVTTSTFTSGARRKAAETNIHLIDGEEFARLLESQTNRLFS
jgi:Holliday junction resolvase